MKYRLLIAALILTVVGAGLLAHSALADTVVTDSQIARIRQDCTQAKSSLTQLHTSDAFLRVDRGQLFESIDTKLMVPFYTRLAKNKIDASSLVAVTTSYESALGSFRSDYQTYEEQLSTTLGIDCTKQPVAFYNALLDAEAKRIAVHSDVEALDTAIANYQTELTTVAGTLGGAQ